ncbi:MAG: hypothetical protein AAF317_13085, partial [Pseudomonadota bacterium]
MYSATVDPDLPVGLGDETLGFVGQTTVSIERQTFDQSSDLVVSKASITSVGRSIFGTAVASPGLDPPIA